MVQKRMPKNMWHLWRSRLELHTTGIVVDELQWMLFYKNV
jgi:hypothetical protein